MSSAPVKEVMKLRESQSQVAFEKPPDDDERSIADKLYTKSEKSLLDGDWDHSAPKVDLPLTEEDLKIITEDEVQDEEKPKVPNPSSLEGLSVLAMLRTALPYWGMESKNGFHDAVRKTLSAVSGAEVNAIDDDTGDTALLLCAQYGAGELVELLVAQNADVHAKLPSGATALHYSTNLSTLAPRAVDKLLQFGADPNVAEQHNGATPLHYAADAGDFEVCQNLVKYGADVSSTDYGGYDAAGYAEGAGHAKIADYLRSKSKDYSIDLPPMMGAPAETKSASSDDNTKKNKAPPKRRRSREIVTDVQEARITLAKLENDRTEQKASKFKYEAEDAMARLERSEQRANDASQEAATLRVKLDAAQQAAEKALADLKTSQTEASQTMASAAATASAAQARAEEIERARARATAVSETSAERAIAAELASAIAKTEAETARRDKALAMEDAEKHLARAHNLELRCEAASAAANAQRESDLKAAQDAEKKFIEYADLAAEKAVALVLEKKVPTDPSGGDETVDADARVKAAEKACEALQFEAAKTRDATSAVVDALKASLEQRALDAEAKVVEVESRAAKAAEEARETLKGREEDLKAKEDQRRAAASSLAAEQADKASAIARAERAEAKATTLEQQLLGLAQASSTDQKVQAMEKSMQVRLAELEKARDDAIAKLHSETAKVHDERKNDDKEREKDAERDAAMERLLVKYDTETAGPRFKKDLVEALEKVLETKTKAQETAALTEVRKELAEAREKLAASTARAMGAEQAKEAASSDVKSLRDEVTALRADERAARAELAASKEAALQAQARADASTGDATAQREALAAAKAEKQRYDDELQAARSSLRRAEEDAAVAKTEQRRLEAEMQAVRRRMEDEAEKRAARDNIDALNAAAEKDRFFESQLTEARRATNAAKAEADAAVRRAEAVAQRVATAELRADAADAALEAMRRERDVATIALRETSEQAESELARARSKVAASQAELATANSAMERVRALEQRNAQLDRDLTREATLRKKLHNTIEDMKGKIRVLCRVRPLSNKETSQGETSHAVIKDGEASLTVMVEKLRRGDAGATEKNKRFTFDSIFEGPAVDGNSQLKIFEDVRLLVTSAVDGYNICLFAYGQTGSGKTYTMGSSSNIGDSFDRYSGQLNDDAGIAPRTAAAVFEILEERQSQCESEVKLQMFEVYCDKIIDLLNPDRNQQGQLKITLAEHSPTGLVVVEGAHAFVATSVESLVKGMAKGIAARTTHATRMNMESSRSHLIMALEVRTTNRRTGAVIAGKVRLNFFLQHF